MATDYKALLSLAEVLEEFDAERKQASTVSESMEKIGLPEEVVVSLAAFAIDDIMHQYDAATEKATNREVAIAAHSMTSGLWIGYKLGQRQLENE